MGLPRIGITSEPLEEQGRRSDGSAREHVDAIVAAGGVPVILPVLSPDLVEASLDGIDGLLLPGGGDVDLRPRPQPSTPALDTRQPAREAFELPLVRAALAAGLPILGVCRGHQVLNVALGGTLVPRVAARSEDEVAAEEVRGVRIAPASLLAAVVGTSALGVSSRHDRAVGRAGAGLQVVGRAADGTIEAVEGLGDLRVLGVQWHPELLLEQPAHAALFAWLVGEAAVTPLVELAEPVAAAEIGPMPSDRGSRAVA